MQLFSQWFSTLNSRMMLFSLVGGLLPVLILGSSTALISAYFVRQQATQLVSDIIHDRVQGVVTLQSPVNSVTRHIVSDTRLLETLNSAKDKSLVSELNINELIGDSLSRYFSLEGLSGISVILDNGRFYSLSTEIEYSQPDFEQIDAQIKGCQADFTEHELCWPGVETNINSNSRHEVIIPAIRKITLLNEQTMAEESIGHLYLGFNVSSYHRLLTNSAISKEMEMIVVDRDNRVVFHPNQEQIGTQVNPLYLPDSDGVAQSTDVDGASFVVISLTAPNTGWRFVMLVPERHLYEGVYQILWVASVLLLISLICIVMAGYNVRMRVLKPLTILTHAMKGTQKSTAGYDSDVNELKEIRTLFYWYNKYVSVVEFRDQQAAELRAAYEQLQITQEQLVESEKMAALGKLVAGVAHEINTPIGVSLTSISYSVELHERLAELFKNNEIKRSDLQQFLDKSQKGLEISANNLHRAVQLVNTFKTVATDQHYEDAQSFSIADYLSNTVTSLEPKTKQKNVSILWRCSSDIILYSYPGVLWQILSNLVMNSLKHAFEHASKGEITIDVEDHEHDVEIIYRDNGSGMDEETCNNIFLPFFTTKRNAGGTGLGMHIVYNLVVQKLQGSISCASQPEQGCEFTIRFPKHLQLPELK